MPPGVLFHLPRTNRYTIVSGGEPDCLAVKQLYTDLQICGAQEREALENARKKPRTEKQEEDGPPP